MPVLAKTESAGFLHEADEWLPAEIIEIQDEEGNFGPQLKWILSLDDDDPGQDTWAFCSQTYSARSKLGKWVTAILGDMPEHLDTDDLEGVNVEIMFEQYETLDQISGENVTKEKVVKIRAAKAKKKPAAKKKKPVKSEDPDPF